METIKYYIICSEEADARKEEDWEHIFIAVFGLPAAVVCIRCECGGKDFLEWSFTGIVSLHPLIEGIKISVLVKKGIVIIG